MKEHPCLGDRQELRQVGADQKEREAWPEMFDDPFRPPLAPNRLAGVARVRDGLSMTVPTSRKGCH